MADGFKVVEDTTGPLKKASYKFKRVEADVTMVLAELVTEEIRAGVLGGKFALTAKSPDWRKRSRDPRPLVHTRRYIDSLKPKRLPNQQAGIQGNLKLAKLLEGGTKNMVGRPHIRPAIAELNKKLNNVLEEHLSMKLFEED